MKNKKVLVASFLVVLCIGLVAGHYITDAIADVPYPTCTVNSSNPYMEVITTVQDNGDIHLKINLGSKVIDYVDIKTDDALLIVTK